MCGGTFRASTDAGFSDGLSPRVRGNRRRTSPLSTDARSIPACAGEPRPSRPKPMASGVYPRVCGGTGIDDLALAKAHGLSPRVRGNRWWPVRPGGCPWSIPACAGEPMMASACSAVVRVYPRVCGGTEPVRLLPWQKRGLSPRVRGNRWLVVGGWPRVGSIPACAGEPTGFGGLSDHGVVYPRVCGGTCGRMVCLGIGCGLSPRVRGNLAVGASFRHHGRSIPACAGEPCGGVGMAYNRKGLSPRVRGNLCPPLADLSPPGSIPACAGEPPAGRGTSAHGGVYPRVCGGTEQIQACHQDIRGLSPRVRGNPDTPLRNRILTRSIPACAGEPPSATWCWTWRAVYPRVCGGTPQHNLGSITGYGLSPRVRGNRRPAGSRRAEPRSIPACAGEPKTNTNYYETDPVYPRVCGGTEIQRLTQENESGLSPRVRGNPRRWRFWKPATRSIPACAGEPGAGADGFGGSTVYPRVCGGTAS